LRIFSVPGRAGGFVARTAGDWVDTNEAHNSETPSIKRMTMDMLTPWLIWQLQSMPTRGVCQCFRQTKTDQALKRTSVYAIAIDSWSGTLRS
jgi:hypothetical protein